ncbi:nucleoside recognition domain-containing protein [Yeguia hominis]|uniref:Spore maturation protein A n=1 Tax=Yeguia hominis TaxID=2763662 RepID=A0A926D611_9FIRM|nr:nucleoside recognition domain-containing protein [Yeguia hominis]MBC8533065.1 spore maturation protein A [Yeguia hominis]
MLNYVWAALMLISFFSALATGRMQALSDAVLSGAQDAVILCASMLGMMCLWTGLMNIAQQGGTTALLSRLFDPLLRRLFPDYSRGSKALQCISMSITANLLGLGNAATPLGIAAMKELDRANGHRESPSNGMVLFVVLNTASVQLIPATLGILRKQYGAQNPFAIMPAVWVASGITLVAGILTAKLLEKKTRRV